MPLLARLVPRTLVALGVALLACGVVAAPAHAAVGDIRLFGAMNGPMGIAIGPDDGIWIANNQGNSIAHLNSDASAGWQRSVGSGPLDITAGPDGAMWFTEQGANAIGRMTIDKAYTQFSAGITAGANLGGITSGPDGNLWFTEYGTDKIGRITPAGTVTEFSAGISAGSGPWGIAVGADGNLWFTESVSGAIGRITPTGTVTEFPATNDAIFDIAAGADGNLWFANSSANAIERVTTSGVRTAFSAGLPSGAAPQWITPGPGGDMWFTTNGAAKAIWRITLAGDIVHIADFVNVSNPQGIVMGVDGNLYVSLFTTGQVAQVQSGATPVIEVDPSIGDDDSAHVGDTLTATRGTWKYVPTSYAYEWQRCSTASDCTTIDGADGSTYTIVAADARTSLRVRVRASNANGASDPAASQSVEVAAAETTTTRPTPLPAPVPAPELPRTGGSTAPLVALSGILIGAGVALSRRRLGGPAARAPTPPTSR